jgi:hypothetical protein
VGLPDVMTALTDADKAGIEAALKALGCHPVFPPLDLARKFSRCALPRSCTKQAPHSVSFTGVQGGAFVRSKRGGGVSGWSLGEDGVATNTPARSLP